LAKTEGFYLTSPDPTVRRRTADYLRTLAEVCADLGGRIIVLGSPQQRNLLPGVSYDDAEAYAVEVLHAAIPACMQFGVTIGIEPLGPAEGDFIPNAKAGVRLAEMVGSRYAKLHLDVKAMSSEGRPIPDILRDSREWLIHFHANDPNLLGPGMGEVDFRPIFAALKEINYDGWVSVEVFKYEPSPDEIARGSIEYMRRIAGKL
jgi:sugar phosphate isomerase/epimerase